MEVLLEGMGLRLQSMGCLRNNWTRLKVRMIQLDATVAISVRTSLSSSVELTLIVAASGRAESLARAVRTQVQ